MIARANMPEISNISLNANYAATTKLPNNKPTVKKKPILETCQSCGKSYDKRAAHKILAGFTPIPAFDCSDQCLICIQEASRKMKVSYQPDLIESKSALEKLTITYQNAHNNYKALSAKYQRYDYIENRIKHHLTKPSTSRTKANPKKSKTSDQIKKETALKILASLTEEQRAAILANMAKQA